MNNTIFINILNYLLYIKPEFNKIKYYDSTYKIISRKYLLSLSLVSKLFFKLCSKFKYNLTTRELLNYLYNNNCNQLNNKYIYNNNFSLINYNNITYLNLYDISRNTQVDLFNNLSIFPNLQEISDGINLSKSSYDLLTLLQLYKDISTRETGIKLNLNIYFNMKPCPNNLYLIPPNLFINILKLSIQNLDNNKSFFQFINHLNPNFLVISYSNSRNKREMYNNNYSNNNNIHQMLNNESINKLCLNSKHGYFFQVFTSFHFINLKKFEFSTFFSFNDDNSRNQIINLFVPNQNSNVMGIRVLKVFFLYQENSRNYSDWIHIFETIINNSKLTKFSLNNYTKKSLINNLNNNINKNIIIKINNYE